jgi:NAD(P)-dependent dehydrogenase (short-subunit alcohol dehydrogenase family)
VTGANTGLGLEAARHLVQLGAAKVIMGVRNVTAGEEARADIQATTGISNVAEVWALDLSSYSSVKAFAKRVTEELDRIDALIENAAVAMSKRVLAEGHTLPVTVNVYSTFLLGVLLLPKMRESSKRYSITSHLSIVTSSASFDFREDWEKIKDNPLGKTDVDETAQLKTYGIPLHDFEIIQFCFGKLTT